MTQTGTDKASAWIAHILHDGGDPRAYRQGIAESSRIPVETVDQIIAARAAPTPLTPAQLEDRAQEQLAADRAYARTHRAEWRRANHEEE